MSSSVEISIRNYDHHVSPAENLLILAQGRVQPRIN